MLSVMIMPFRLMRFSMVLKKLRCSFFVASKKAMSKYFGVRGMSSGAWPRIWMMLVRPERAMFSLARLKRSFLWDSMV